VSIGPWFGFTFDEDKPSAFGLEEDETGTPLMLLIEASFCTGRRYRARK
jgi:hypothetical protein